jgi:putative transposase
MSRPRKKGKPDNRNLQNIVYRYQAYLTPLQEFKLENWFYVLWDLYNSAIDERQRVYKSEKKSISYTEQQNRLPLLKKLEPIYRIVHSQVLQDCLWRVDRAYQKFFSDLERKRNGEKIKVGYPRKKKLRKYSSITYPQVWSGEVEIIKLRPVNKKFALIYLPGIGDIKIRLHRPLNWQNARAVTIKRVPSGRWYVCITVAIEPPPVIKSNGRRTGIDLGVEKVITDSQGNFVEHPGFIYKAEQRIKKYQRDLARKQKGSNNYEKQRLKLAGAHERVKNQRLDFLHKLSLWLVFMYEYIAFENLKIPAMVKNHNLAKAILDAGWGTLIRLTTYKSVMLRGNSTVRVSPAYTTQDCSVCGYRVPKTLADRLHVCPECGVVIDRDHNAARNIEARAFSSSKVGTERAEPNACGDAVLCEALPCKMASLKQESPCESSGWATYRKPLL